jgi:hypothetical protein
MMAKAGVDLDVGASPDHLQRLGVFANEPV